MILHPLRTLKFVGVLALGMAVTISIIMIIFALASGV